MPEESIQGPRLGFKCLLCARRIEPGDFDPCVLTLTARADRPRREQMRQDFYCHLACLQAKAEVRDVFYIAEPGYSTIGELEDEASSSGDEHPGVNEA
jgi:hypothetical protein